VAIILADPLVEPLHRFRWLFEQRRRQA
jgi:hypothetical protein